MKRRTVKTLAIAVALTGCMVLSACGSVSKDSEGLDYNDNSAAYYGFNSYSETTEAGETQDVQYEAEAMEENSDSVANGTSSSVTDSGEELSRKTATMNKKIIKTYNYSYDTETFDEAYAYLKEQINAYHGYISNSNIYSDGYISDSKYGTDYRKLSLTARIPVEECDEFVNQLGSLGTAVRQSESTDDVTLQYNDTESRITSLKTEQQRINELLKDADSLETIIALEDRLTEIRYELENYQSQKNLYDDLITYCTVNISLYEVSYEVPVDDSTVLSRMKSGLVTSFRDIGHGFTNFLVWFVVKLPYLAIWGLIIYGIYRLIRRIVKKSKAKRQAKKEAKAAAQKTAVPQQAVQQRVPALQQVTQQQPVQQQPVQQPVQQQPQQQQEDSKKETKDNQ